MVTDLQAAPMADGAADPALVAVLIAVAGIAIVALVVWATMRIREIQRNRGN